MSVDQSDIAERKAVAGQRPVRGRPRSAASEQAILIAALDLMAEGHGPASITIAAIARRAGAGKDTIYRRWQTKEDLLLDAMAFSAPPVQVPQDTPFREALVLALSEGIARLQNDRDRRILRSMQSADDGFVKLRERYYAQVVQQRSDAIRELANAAMARGELPDHAGLRDAIEMPFHHLVMRASEDDPISGDPTLAAQQLVETVLHRFIDPQA